MNSYLAIAAKVIDEARQPLSARQMLRAAYQMQVVPAELYGKTQYKTLHARLAEDILKNKARSRFVRTGPGRFFLRELFGKSNISEPLGREYIAPLRSNQLKRFYVLCVSRAALERLAAGGREAFEFNDLNGDAWSYRQYSSAEFDAQLLCVRIVVILRRGSSPVLQRRAASKSGSDSPISIGFFGFAKREDKTLFALDKFGLHEAAMRTLFEQIHLQYNEIERLTPNAPAIKTKFFFDLKDPDLSQAICAIISYDISGSDEVEFALNSTSQYDFNLRLTAINDLSQMDAWSRRIALSPVLQGIAGIS